MSPIRLFTFQNNCKVTTDQAVIFIIAMLEHSASHGMLDTDPFELTVSRIQWFINQFCKLRIVVTVLPAFYWKAVYVQGRNEIIILCITSPHTRSTHVAAVFLAVLSAPRLRHGQLDVRRKLSFGLMKCNVVSHNELSYLKQWYNQCA